MDIHFILFRRKHVVLFMYSVLSIWTNTQANDICDMCKCSSKLVQCTSVPEQLPFDTMLQKFTYLRVKKSNVVGISEGKLVSGFLKTLHITNCDVEVNATSFQFLINLEVLEITNSSIIYISPQSFINNSNLKRIDMSNNKITDLPNTLFWYLPQLEEVFLDENNIHHIFNGTFVKNSKIRTLIIKNNRLQALQTETLSINNVMINDPSAKDVKMDISHNMLSSFKNYTFRDCFNLTHLYASSNRIALLHQKTFVGLTSLQVLDLGNNSLTEIPMKAFYDCKRLTTLFLRQNKICHLHLNAFYGLYHLHYLHLEENFLQVLGNAFTIKWPKLVHLNISRNNISIIQKEMFRGCYNMLQLNLSYNNISVIENNSFESNVHLQELYLQNNHIEKLQYCLFQNLTNLHNLNMENNFLLDVSFYHFCHLNNLKNLSLGFKMDGICECQFFESMKQRRVNLSVGNTSSMSKSCRSNYKNHYSDPNSIFSYDCFYPSSYSKCHCRETPALKAKMKNSSNSIPLFDTNFFLLVLTKLLLILYSLFINMT